MEALMDLSVPQLKQVLKQHKLPVTGNKTALVKRVWNIRRDTKITSFFTPTKKKIHRATKITSFFTPIKKTKRNKNKLKNGWTAIIQLCAHISQF